MASLWLWCLVLLSALNLPTSSAWLQSTHRPVLQGLARCSCSSTEIFLTPQLQDDFDPLHSSSRRQWLSQIASAAVTTVVASTPAAYAVETTAVDSAAVVKPTAAICDPSVSVWSKFGRSVYLVGTAHISSSSAMLAGEVVNDARPEAVFVELDAKRIGKAGVDTISGPVPPATSGLTASTSVGSTNAAGGSSSIVSSGPTAETSAPVKQNPFNLRQRALQAGSAAVGNAIQGMYKKLDSTGFKPGEEFVVAVREGQKIGSTIILGDRDVEVTLRRLTQALSETDLAPLLSPDSDLERSMQELMPSGPPPNTLTDAEFKDEMTRYVEVMKAKDNVKKVMNQLKLAAPKLYEALVAERDVYMATGLDSLNQFPSIVAVMGIAHVDGVENYLSNHGWKPAQLRCPKS